MSKANEAAYACASDNGHQMGLTKLEPFSAMAMQGAWFQLTDLGQSRYMQPTAESCVAMARALIAELEKQTP